MQDYAYYYISISIIYILIASSFFVVLKKWHQIKFTKERIFLPFLSFTIVMELWSQYVVWVQRDNPSSVIDLYTLGAILFAIYWFYKYLKKLWIAMISVAAVIGSYILSLSHLQVYTNGLPALAITAALVITLTVFLFFNQLLKTNAIHRFKVHRPFWIAVGFFVFHINAMPYILFLPNLSRLTWQVSGVLVFFNLIMYGCFIYAFSLKKPIYE